MDRSNLIFAASLMLLIGIGFIVNEFVSLLLLPIGVRLLLVHAIFFACALTVSFPLMLTFAFMTGFIWDATHMTVTGENDVGFGYSVFLLGVTGSLMQGMRPFFKKGRWEAPVLLVGIATTILLLLEWFFVSFGRVRFIVPDGFWRQLWVSVFLCMVISPFLFFLIFKLSRLSGCPVLALRDSIARSR